MKRITFAFKYQLQTNLTLSQRETKGTEHETNKSVELRLIIILIN